VVCTHAMMDDATCRLCKKSCEDGCCVFEAQWYRLDQMRGPFADNNTDGMNYVMDKFLKDVREEVEKWLKTENALVKASEKDVRHMSHFVTVRNNQRVRANVCIDCTMVASNLWNKLQLTMHQAVSEILGWADWNDIGYETLYDPGIIELKMTPNKREKLLRENRFA